mmetsp:Transcript_39525/g.80634  ORF Transcript_39525/g.80634 Transcript_39525/m.80634 type:complete len:322 (-) Transcript_39525:31-996(-)
MSQPSSSHGAAPSASTLEPLSSASLLWFLASTFGFHGFFKCAAAAEGSHPNGADVNLSTWLTWFVSMPEPVFAKGKMKRVTSGEIIRRLGLCVVEMLGTSALLTIMMDAFERGKPLGSEPLLGGFIPASVLNGFLGIWFLYFWASFCLDFSAVATSVVHGCSCQDGFRNPLIASRSMRECWGLRWDLPVQLFLKRTLYIPARRAGVPSSMAVILTFIASGLLHEYNFSIHNTQAYQPGFAMLFFLLMGLLMVVEGFLERLCPKFILEIISLVPTFVVSCLLVLIAAAPFESHFIQSWIEAGVLESVGEMVPHFRCQSHSHI